jgi:hypothetical protein
MLQALAKHIKQLVELLDALRETTIRRFKKLYDSCCCHNERVLAVALAEDLRPQECLMARLLRAVAAYSYQSSCQSVSPWEWQGEILAGRRCSCTCATRRRPQGQTQTWCRI